MYRGRYVNVDYGFSVQIPPALVGEGNPGDAPNHGFELVVQPQITIWLDASYDMDGGSHKLKSNTHLGTLQANRRIWRDFQGSNEMFHESVVALGSDRGTGIVYTIHVDAPIAQRRAADRALRNLASTFWLVPIKP